MAPDMDQKHGPMPPLPSYNEAIAGSSRSAIEFGQRSDDDDGDHDGRPAEGQSLLTTRRPSDTQSVQHARGATASRGYRRPTVESEDEDALDLVQDDDGDSDAEAAHVWAETQQLEMMDGEATASRSSFASWGKRLGQALPRWRWKGLWWPSLPRRQIWLGDQHSAATGGCGGQDGAVDAGRRWRLPRLDLGIPGLQGTAALLLVGRRVIVFIVLGLLFLVFMSDVFASMARKMGSQVFDPESVRVHVQSHMDARRLRETLEHYTNYMHVAGSEGDWDLARDTRMLFEEYGLEDVRVDEYWVYLNYPRKDGRTVQILGQDGAPTWTASLEEDVVGGETAGHETGVFHGHSKAGDVQGPLMYANYGTRDDFKRLYDSGIETEGAIALVRQFGSETDQAMKIKAAELAGFAGCLVFTDPADNGFMRGDPAPTGRYMPADGVQRAGVSLASWLVGDVLTPGWASKKGAQRIKPSESGGLVKIPSLPLAWRDAQVLLQQLEGFGQQVPAEWVGGVPGMAAWWTGNMSGPVVRLQNEQDENEQQAIWNVYGRIVGVEQSEKKIMVGNHRDSWGFGSAAPGSGTAVMMEVARVFGGLLGRGWRPQRTIEFMSWDAGAYNRIGSTEFVEQNDVALRADAMAYINLDAAVTGNTFRAAGSPVFRALLRKVLSRIGDPSYNVSLRELWDRRGAQLAGLGAASDYVAFQDIAGTSSLDLAFGSDEPFPSHSNHEDFAWMDSVGDPGFVYHVLLAQVLGLLVLELANRPVLPFDMPAYANALTTWVGELVEWAANKGANQEGNLPLDWTRLQSAVHEVAVHVRDFVAWEMGWEKSVLASSGREPSGLGKERCDYNTRMATFETDLLDSDGIPNRNQFKHVVFGPQLWSAHDEAFFPSIRDSIVSGDWTLANRTVEKVARILQRAAGNLVKAD